MAAEKETEVSWMAKGASKVEDPSGSGWSNSSTKTVIFKDSKPKSSPSRDAGSHGPKEVDRSKKEMIKRLRSLYLDEGEDYPRVEDDPKADDDDVLMERYKRGIKLARRRIGQVMQEIEASTSVDLCFLMDCTGSMADHIAQVKDSISRIVDQCVNGPAKSIRCAFVGYRDFCDGPLQFEVLDFTQDINSFKRFCSALSATGGGDGAEDVFGGLEKATSLKWDRLRMTRVIFHIADAPAHGKEFHAGCTNDDYADRGDPEGRTAAELFNAMRLKAIQYNFGTINSRLTDLMIEKFTVAYGEDIVKFDVKDPIRIEAAVVKSVTASVSKSVRSSKSGTRSHLLRDYEIDPAEPSWNRLPVEIGSYLSYDFPDSIQNLLDPFSFLTRKLKRNVKVQVALKPFSQGSERIAYYGRDLSRDDSSEGATSGMSSQEIVLKEYKHMGKGMNSPVRYEKSAQIQTIATFFARKFDKLHRQPDVTVKFLKVKTISIPLGASGKARYMNVEKRLPKSTLFIRFTNNVDYKIIEEKTRAAGVSQAHVDLLLAFSHWTYEVSHGQMMIVDLQGVFCKDTKQKDTLLLTDPAIHCVDPTRYRPLNLGRTGMMKFFETHDCNDICRCLGLKAVKLKRENQSW